MNGDKRCVEGRLLRHDPQFDDPYLETDVGQCPDCGGAGCEEAMTTDDELLALAKKATQGEWQYPGIDEVNPDLITAGRDHDGAFIYPIDADENEADNRAFVAAANPAAIIALIERHRAEVAQLRADRDLAYDKLARKGAEVEELRQYAPMCLVCGARKPCMTEADLKPGDPGTPCTFDPTPKEAAAEILRLRAEVETLRNTPVNCELFCPSCGKQHIDQPQPADGQARGHP